MNDTRTAPIGIEPITDDKTSPDDVDNGSDDAVTGPRRYTRRQLRAMAAACLILGIGLGMAYTTATFIRDQRERNDESPAVRCDRHYSFFFSQGIIERRPSPTLSI